MTQDVMTDELRPDTGCYIGPAPYKKSLCLVFPMPKDGKDYGFPGQTVQVVSFKKMKDGYAVDGKNSLAAGDTMDDAVLEAVLRKETWLRTHKGQVLIHEETGEDGEKILSKVGGK